MNFTKVKADIQKLIGLELESIRPGARIKILEINNEKGGLILRTASGRVRKRPMEELEKIWNEMLIKPVVHVEGVLHGSGTSRNQPETILANLPYVEWLKIDNKKHIAYVGKDTHAYGTLKQMDTVDVIERMSRIKKSKVDTTFFSAIVTSDIKRTISDMQSFCSGTVTALEKGIYELETSTGLILFISSDMWELEEGTYCVVEASDKVNFRKHLTLYGKYYSVICQGNIKALVKNN